MRVIAGELKGRQLKTPASFRIRPTSDRLRETIFNVLLHAHGVNLAGAAVLDLFAGTGAFGVECLSRGVRTVLFVDQSAEVVALIAENLRALKLQDRAQVIKADASRLKANQHDESYDLVFLDPPYGKGLAPAALRCLTAGGWLKTGSIVVAEIEKEGGFDPPEGCTLLDERVSGKARVFIFAFSNEDPSGNRALCATGENEPKRGERK